MAIDSLRPSRRDKRIAFKTRQSSVDGRGHSTVGEQWVVLGNKYWASAYFGSGDEQRASAQDGATQKASFDVLSNSVTRLLSVKHRLYYPVSDTDPDKWPAWDIRGIVPLGKNEGFRVTVESAPT
ncbi:phage head completion protein [Sphingobium cupriresistens]|uniref:phage head completion protein n=1 Tax=Sphingobium cupriresistens TaxID=1132417 RepID=UPI00147046CB|nr:head-tail adaptor protein [Sphingobium cupriresistens]